MPRDGSGTFTRIHDWTADAAAQVNVLAPRMDADTDDIAAALTASLAKDGQTDPTANLPMATYRHTDVGAAVGLTDYARADQVQGDELNWISSANVGGTADVITLTPSPAATAYADGLAFRFLAGATNTGAVTINVSGLGAKSLRIGGRTLTAGALVSGRVVKVVYDGTYFQLLNPARFFFVDDYFSGDGDAAINAALAAAESAGGGIVQLGYGTYDCDADVTIGATANEISLVGMGPNASIMDFTGGGKLDIQGNYDFLLKNLTVQNGTGNNIEIGTTAGAQTFATYFSINNVNSLGAGGAGVVFGSAFQGNVQAVRSNNATTFGFDFASGHNTSLNILNCQALNTGSAGWRLRSMSFCNMLGVSADDCGTYGYILQGLDACKLSGSAEGCGSAAININHDNTSGDTITQIKGLMIDGFKSNNNAQTVTNRGEIIHFTSAQSGDTGDVSIRGLVGANQTQETYYFEGGSYRVNAPWQLQNVDKTAAGTGASVLLNGATDYATGVAISVPAANTPIATLSPKIPNSVSSYAGRLTVHAVRNSFTGSSSLGAVYELLVIRHATGGALSLVDSAGYTSGAAATEASFTFGLDAANNHLEVTPIGSTGSGPWFFYISADGNIDVEML